MKKRLPVILLILTTINLFSSPYISLDQSARGFWGTGFSAGSDISENINIGLFYQTSGLMLVQGDFDTGEWGALIKWTAPINNGFTSDISFKTGYRYQNQNLGSFHSFFTSADIQAGYRWGAVETGFEGMMFGFFPFYAEIACLIPLGKKE